MEGLKFRCIKCTEEAVTLDFIERVPLCKNHFIESVLKRVRKEFQKVPKGSKVLLAVSGGKDSLVLMDVSAKVWDTERLVAVTVIEGAEGYDRGTEISNAAKLARELGIQYFVTSFKDVYGKSLMEIIKIGKERPCTYCGVLRRRIIDLAALALNADFVATGHTLDDEVHTSLLNVLRGDWEGVLKLSQGRLKPLRRVLEREVAIYAYLKNFPFQTEECPYITTRPSLRARIRENLFQFSESNASSLLKWIENLETKSYVSEHSQCSVCGFPTSKGRTICRACEFAQELGLRIVKRSDFKSLPLKRVA
ncbi:potassium-transporting ATPase subunit A [Ignicoccus islandicus DSM 13165]|uniref:Potassium-transporting ATPase subunit A n=1 Tax=Ignicoccus islandicus DSM 13165 TaxID=940295 RepID=A0A0U3E7I8_9CREN|nr:TIGR00269 family protein [Ignicoccus islandicus]ALU11342.1 potassium-transporting ATPase subunit A [Ignicoccus islandicus DSM 13165]